MGKLSLIRAHLPFDAPSATNGRGHIIVTAAELREAWAARDGRYAERATPLTEAEVTAIRVQREYEAGFVEPRFRGPLHVAARHWSPPRLGEWS